MLPRFLIIGAQKCGTTWLHHHLAGHPKLFLPAGKDDEFFSYQPVRPLAHYRQKFAAAPEGVVCGDSCASYLWSPHPDDRQPENFNPAIPATVRDALGADCRLIVLLKDPVARTLSAYLHHIAYGSLNPNTALFDAPPELGLIALSRYGWHLRHWLATFPAEQLLVVPDPGSTDVRTLLTRVMAFLGIADEHPFSDVEGVVYGGLRRRLDDSGLWVTVGQRGLDSLEMIRRSCPTLERGDATEVRLVEPAEIDRLSAMLRADTDDFAVLAETHGWTDPAFNRWRSWPQPSGSARHSGARHQTDGHRWGDTGADVGITIMTAAIEPLLPDRSKNRVPVVDVIIPVYRGLDETQRCLNSVLAFPQQTAHEVVVVNDCSPEPELAAYLRELAGTGAITLLENPVNTGFVNAVNRGMVLHPDRDVVLLNSDTEVNGDWLDRLRRCAESGPMIGTATPFSNNATICSYPRFMQDNPLAGDWPLAALDALFAETNDGQSVEMPTAVGFCMYITRRCLEQVGYFDATLFKRGYGEENDFSMRALEVGFRHLLAADVFVYHRGGISFGAEQTALRSEAQQVLEQRHPRYIPLVNDHCSRDPARLFRRRVDTIRLARSPRPRLLFIMHKGGGGTEKHVRELAALLESDYEGFLLRAYDATTAVLEWARRGEEFSAWFPLPHAYPDLLAFLRTLPVARIHIHHVLDLQRQLLRLPEDLRTPYDFTLHDYYPICPQYDLAQADGRYCGEPDTAGCTACLAERPAPWGLDILSWRTLFRRLLTGADRVFAPSRDALERMRAYVPEARYVHLPHPEPKRVAPPVPSSDLSGELKVVALGRLTPAKGLRLLEACAADARVRGLPLFFRVIGYAAQETQPKSKASLSFSGLYDDDELPLLVARERPDLFVFPAQMPETYSYTLSVAMRTGLPIIASRLGAFSERLADYPRVRLLDWDTPAAGWNDALMTFWRGRDLSTIREGFSNDA